MNKHEDYLNLYKNKNNPDLIINQILKNKENDILKIAGEFQAKGIYKVAIPLYRELLKEFGNQKIYIQLAISLGKSFQFRESLEQFNKCLVNNTYVADNMNYYAYILEKNSELEQALHYYEKALETTYTNDLWTISHYAYCLEKAGKLDLAQAKYDEVFRINEKYTWAIKRYFIFLFSTKNLKSAAQQFLDEKLKKYQDDFYLKLIYVEYLILINDETNFGKYYKQLESSKIDTSFLIIFNLLYYLFIFILKNTPDIDELKKLKTLMKSYPLTIHRDFDDLDKLVYDKKVKSEEWEELKKLLIK